MKNNRFSRIVTVFQERTLPEEGYLVGYAAIIQAYDFTSSDTGCFIDH